MDKETATRKADGLLDRAENVYEDQGKILRTLWVVVGFIVVSAGVAMIVFPGPVTIVVPAGLIMLAAAFGWARRLLMKTVQAGVDAQQAFARASTWTKALTYVASACVAAAVVAVIVL
jgi:hypothetical protein